jgi:hypothetical protein
MPIDDEGRFYRNPRRNTDTPKPNSQAFSNPQQASSDEEMSGFEAIGILLACLIGLVVAVAAAYGAWLGAVWLYEQAIKVVRVIYEFRELIVGLVVLLVFSAIRGIFD